MCTLIIGCLWALAACEPDLVQPGLHPPAEPVLAQMSEPVEIQVAPAGDTYVSRTSPAQNFGADTLLILDGDHRPLLRWDSAAVAEAIGNGSLVEARLELTVLSNSGGWPGNARWVALHAMSEEWVEEEASWDCSSADPAPCDPWSMDEPEELEGPQGPYDSPWNPQATDSLQIMNNTQGTIAFDVTNDVLAAQAGGVYGDGWLLKRVDETRGGALEIGAWEGGSGPRLVLSVQFPEQVPGQAPDTVPAGFYDPENIRMGTVCVSGPMLRGIVVITFVEGASQAERQEAVDLVGGEVVGGIRSGDREGFYYVRVEDDQEGQVLCDAMLALNELPQVSLATPSSFFEPQHRRPNDEAGDWSKTAWSVHPDSVTLSDRWGLEAIAAPLAWGCSTGSQETPLAVVDVGFQAVDDLVENVLPQWRGDVDVNQTSDHGTKVASVLAARGDNHHKITGAMWRADLRLYDASVVDGVVAAGGPTGERILAALERASDDGADVINVSLGLPWFAPPDEFEEADHDRVHRWRDRLAERLQLLDPMPLVILAAGNDTVDAYWTGFAAAQAVLPGHILVVGASTVDGDLWAGSNHGELVHVVAPGDSVGTLDGEENVVPVSGTSFAAPYAAGVAGLLKSFDPRLGPAEIKQLIVEGAISGGRLVPTPSPFAPFVPLLNAYEPLKAAARRDGAPLCGSRIAMNGDTVMVQRESGWEHIFTLEGDQGRLNAHHGGRMIDVYLYDDWTFEGSRLRFALQDGAWTHLGDAPELSHPGAPEGSIFNSMHGTSHDRDTTATAWAAAFFEKAEVTVRATTDPGTVYATHVLPLPTEYESTSVCLRRNDQGNCSYMTDEGSWGDFLEAAIAWIPRGGSVVVAVRRGTTTMSLSEWFPCGTSGSECRDLEVHLAVSTTDLYELDLAVGAWHPLFTVPYYVEDLAISEDGKEIVTTRFRRDHHEYRQWEGESSPNQIFVQQDSDCAVEWRSYATSDVIAASPFEKTCRTVFYDVGTEVFERHINPFLGSLAP